MQPPLNNDIKPIQTEQIQINEMDTSLKNETLSPGAVPRDHPSLQTRRNAAEPAVFTGEAAQYFQCMTCDHPFHHTGITCTNMVPNQRPYCSCSDQCGTGEDHKGRRCGTVYEVIKNQDIMSWLSASDVKGWGLADSIGPAFAELVFNDFKYAATLTQPTIPFDSWMKRYCGSWDEDVNEFMYNLCRSLRNYDFIKSNSTTAFDLQLLVDRRYNKHEHFIPLPEIRYLPLPIQAQCQCVHCTCAKCVPEILCGCTSDCQCKDCKETRPWAFFARDMIFPYAVIILGALVIAAALVLFGVLPGTIPNRSQVWMYLVPAVILFLGVIFVVAGIVFGYMKYSKLLPEFYRGTLNIGGKKKEDMNSSSARLRRSSLERSSLEKRASLEKRPSVEV